MTEIIVDVPHDVTILADESCGFQQQTLESHSSEVARARSVSVDLGVIACEDLMVPLKSVDYTRTINLPKPSPGVMRVVSQITVLAAHNEGRTTDDLLVPFGFQCVPGAPVGARALAIPEFAEPMPRDSNETPLFMNRVQNTGGRRESLYPATFDEHVFEHEKKTMPVVLEPAPRAERLDVVYEKIERDDMLSEQYKVPIVRTRVDRVSGLESVSSGILGIVEPRILMALGGAVMSNGSYIGAIVGSEVRNAEGPFRGAVAGGRSLAIPPIGGRPRPRI